MILMLQIASTGVSGQYSVGSWSGLQGSRLLLTCAGRAGRLDSMGSTPPSPRGVSSTMVRDRKG